jgi:hypothetical protein
MYRLLQIATGYSQNHSKNYKKSSLYYMLTKFHWDMKLMSDV